MSTSFFRAALLLFFSSFYLAGFSQNWNYPVSPAKGFCLFTERDVTLKNGVFDGAVAIGGKLSLDGRAYFSAGSTGVFLDKNDTQPTGLWVGDEVLLRYDGGAWLRSGTLLKVAHTESLRVKDAQGKTVLGDDAAQAAIHLSARQQVFNISEMRSLNPAAGFEALRNISKELSECPQNVQVGKNDEGTQAQLQLVPNRVNIWNISATELQQYQKVEFQSQPNIVTPLIINVAANGENIRATMPAMTNLTATCGSFVLWNFRQCPSAVIQVNHPLIGTILAPETDAVLSGNGNIEGHLLLRALFFQANEVHDRPFLSPVWACGAEISTISPATENAIQSAFNFTIYPNPAETTLNIATDGPTPAWVRIFSTQGRQLRLLRLTGTQFSVNDLPADQYFAEFLDDQEQPLAVRSFQKVD